MSTLRFSLIVALALGSVATTALAQQGMAPYGMAQHGLAATASVPAPPASVGFQWTSDLAAAKAQAKTSGKLVLVHFYTPSCQPCKMLESRVFNQPNVATPIQEKYVPVKLNANEAPAVAQSFGITQVPTDVVVTPEGKMVEKLVSPAMPTAYISRLTGIANRYASQNGGGFQLAAAQAPYNKAVNNTYAALEIPPAPPVSPAPAPAAPQQTLNPYLAQNPAPQQPAPPVAPNPAQQPAAPTQAATATPPAVPPAMAEAAKPGVPNPATPQPKPATAAPQLPPNTPPLGFEGYCPVTMKRDWKWVRGDVKWGAIHAGRTYLFASQADQQEFLSKPEAYSPALSGVDPVIALESGKATPGTRKYALEYRGTFYLFSSEETLNKFWSNAEGYAQGVRQAMSQPAAPRFR